MEQPNSLPEEIAAEDLEDLVEAGGLTRIIEDALHIEARGGPVDLRQLWTDIKQALLEDGPEPTHAAASLAMGPSAAAAAAAPPKWKCKLKRDLKADWPTGPNPDCYYGIEAITYERAKTLSSKLARKHSRKPERMRKKKNPTLGKCPPPQ